MKIRNPFKATNPSTLSVRSSILGGVISIQADNHFLLLPKKGLTFTAKDNGFVANGEFYELKEPGQASKLLYLVQAKLQSKWTKALKVFAVGFLALFVYGKVVTPSPNSIPPAPAAAQYYPEVYIGNKTNIQPAEEDDNFGLPRAPFLEDKQ